MMCDRCGQRQATVHITEIANGQKNETHLCEVCAGEMQQQGYGFGLPPIQLHHFLASMFSNSINDNKQQQEEKTGRVCEKCGATEEQIAQQALLGCGECYLYFAERVRPLLRKIHGSTRHTGKVPERTGGRVRLVKEISILKNSLKEAVRQENFEEAARLRDKIRSLENNLQAGGEPDVTQDNS